MTPEPANRPMRIAALFALSIVLSMTGNKSRAESPPCHSPQQPKQVAELLFGRDSGGRLRVSAAAWARFLAHEITPRFPDGLTVTDALGQWRDPARGTIVRELSKRVEIVLPGHAEDEARLDAVVAAYEREFHQRSVVVIVRTACVSF